ncbi:endonuclease domain-containing protein [Allorhizocola rhizosphaerae]|uniref:endonuclease domain-containing protein n=1 Tax=Allorhizocola rhizosphaerae TaxID=1872709 RepID=UPI000E3EDA6B|nr:DUF559 domain-containing protein [Allorhizocola rhizosphaerae]
MTPATLSGSQWWEQIRGLPVVALTGVSADDLASILDPLPVQAPAVIFSPPVDVTSAAACISDVLTSLERAAIELFPAWLPGAVGIVGAQGANEAAVRAAASSLAAAGEDFGPFLAELAVHALRGRPTNGSAILNQHRAAGLARVIARSLDRSRAALVLTVPPNLAAHEQQVLAGVGRWLTEHSALAVWLVGNPLSSVDWITTWPVNMGAPPTALVNSPPNADAAPIRLAIEGQPKPGREAKLAQRLAVVNWAGLHIWNRSLDLGALYPAVFPDVRWPAEQVIVEVDGPEHRGAAMYESDRRRDATLLLHDYAVLRFTNEQIDHDLSHVLHTIRDLLQKRRNP